MTSNDGGMHPFDTEDGVRCVVCEVNEDAHSDIPCACGGCGSHEFCRGMGVGKRDLCVWCEIEAKVEKRWAKMLEVEGDNHVEFRGHDGRLASTWTEGGKP